MNQNKQTIALLERYREILLGHVRTARNDDCETELLLSGLITITERIPVVSNKIYRKVFDLNWISHKLEETWHKFQIAEQADDVSLLLPQFKEFKWFVCIGSLLLGISFMSIWSAYRWFTSPLWQTAFAQGETEESIELVRTLLYILGSFYFIGVVWRKEAYELLKNQHHRAKNWRFTFSGVGIVVFFLSVYYHFYLGPVTLQSEYGNEAEMFWQHSFIPYLVYLPYTLVNYNVIAVAWVAVSSYGAFKDLNTNLIRTHRLSEKLASLAELAGE